MFFPHTLVKLVVATTTGNNCLQMTTCSAILEYINGMKKLSYLAKFDAEMRNPVLFFLYIYSFYLVKNKNKVDSAAWIRLYADVRV